MMKKGQPHHPPTSPLQSLKYPKKSAVLPVFFILLFHVPTSFTFSVSRTLLHSHKHPYSHRLSSNAITKISSSNQPNEQPSQSTSKTTSTSKPKSTSSDMTDRIIQAAAELTTSTSSLLGVKSIGVDYGLVRTGIAVSNGYNPQPLSILSHYNNTQLSNHIIKLTQSEKATQIVMGLPFHKNGTEAEQTVITRNFASQLNCALCAHFGYDAIPIYLWDERYTSKEAESRIRAENPRAGLLYKDLDADAASIILEYYYAENGFGAERVMLPDNQDVRNAVEQAWNMRKEEKKRELELLKESRMNAGNKKQELIEKARILDAKLAQQHGHGGEVGSKNRNQKKGKKKKKKRKRTWIHLSPNNMGVTSSADGPVSENTNQ